MRGLLRRLSVGVRLGHPSWQVLHDEAFGNGQEAVVSPGVQVCVVSSPALEVDIAEAVVACEDIAFPVGIEDGNAPLSADIDGGINHLQEVRVVVAPRGEPQDAGFGIATDESLAHLSEPLPVSVYANRVEQRGIVVPCDNDNEVERVGHLLIALPEGWAEVLAVDGDTSPVPSVVQVLKAVLMGELVVPCVLNRLTVVADIAVADNCHPHAGSRFLCNYGNEGKEQPQRCNKYPLHVFEMFSLFVGCKDSKKLRDERGGMRVFS